MATTGTTRGQSTGTGDVTIASFTIPAGHTAIAAWAGNESPPTNPDLPALTGHGTWQNLANVTFDDGVSNVCRAGMWWYHSESGSTATLVFGEGSNGWSDAVAQVVTFDEMNGAGSPAGASGIVQSDDNSVNNSDTVAIDGFASFTDATNNVGVVAVALLLSPSENLTIGSTQSVTEYGELDGGDIITLNIGWYTGEDTAPTGDWTTATGDAVIMAVELDNEGVGGGGVTVRKLINGGLINNGLINGGLI